MSMSNIFESRNKRGFGGNPPKFCPFSPTFVGDVARTTRMCELDNWASCATNAGDWPARPINASPRALERGASLWDADCWNSR